MLAESTNFLVRRAKCAAWAVGIGASIAFAGAGQAVAEQCANGPDKVWLNEPTDPPASDEKAITKLISLYHWALDDQRMSDLPDLFVDDVKFELCNAAGDRLAFKASKTDLLTYIQAYIISAIQKGKPQTRHTASNTLLNAKDADTIEGKTTIVVTLQHSDIETPVLDYTGALRTVFKRDGDAWKFAEITLITDGPRLELRAR